MKTISFFAIVLSFSLMISNSAFAADVHGIFMVVKGDVKITSGGKVEAAKVGKKVFPGDSIEAAADSRAKVVMSDKNVLNVSPDSKIVIEKYENDGKDKKNVELNVLYGKVRASVEQKYDGEKSKFNIKTPSAVAGVRGTDFITGYNPSTKVSQVVTFSGVVAVGTPGPGGTITNPVFVRPGQMTSAGAGQAPEAPKSVPTEELKSMNTESVSVVEPKAETAAQAAQATAEPKAEEPAKERAPASVAPVAAETAPAAAPSMIDSKDLGPAVSKDINVRTPTSVPTFIAPVIPGSPGMQPNRDFIDSAIRNQKTKLNITIDPKAAQ